MTLAAKQIPGRRRLSPCRLIQIAKTRTGVLALTTVGNLVVRTGSSMLLTRLLRPSDFGIVGIITSVFFVVTMITDLGFEAFLVRHERTEERHFRDVIWTIHARRGFFLCLAVAIASPAIAWAFDKPVVASPLAVASVTFLINGFASLSMMTALRQDKARLLSFLDLGLQLFSSVVCIVLAVLWRSAWSIIGAMLLQSALRTFLSYALFEHSTQRLAVDRAVSREFFAFSRIVLISSTLTLLIGQSDKLVLGRLFTLGEFGLYAVAQTIATAPIAFGESYIRRIAYPVYALTLRQAPGELGKVYYSVKRRTSLLYALGCGGLIGGARLLVALLYDPRYASAATFISLLMIASTLRLSNSAASELLTARGDMKRMLRFTVVRVLWLAVAFPTGFALFGTRGVVGAVGLIEVPAMLYSWVALRRAGVLDLREELAFLALVAAGAAIGLGVATEVLRLFPNL